MTIGRTGEMWTQPKDGPGATVFRIANGAVEVAALIAGDGIDLVTRNHRGKTSTQQLSTDEARELAAAITKAADESERL